jgi:hypothetical protein
MQKTAFVKANIMDEQNIHKYRGCRFTMMYASSDMPEYEPTHKCGTHPCCPKARRELHDYVTQTLHCVFPWTMKTRSLPFKQKKTEELDGFLRRIIYAISEGTS